jgi:hypothetical protein
MLSDSTLTLLTKGEIRYPAFEGENPTDFYCVYDPDSGLLTTDNDAGFCPANAITCSSSRKRTNPLVQLMARRPSGKLEAEKMDRALAEKKGIWSKRRT